MYTTFGTYRLSSAECLVMVKRAYALGIRSFDTAQLYRTEEPVNQALSQVGYTDVHITTKIHRTDIKAAAKDPQAIAKSVEKSLKVVQPRCILLHSPEVGYVEAWRQLSKVQEDRMTIESVGVSNFGIEHLEELRKAGLPTPEFNQIEITPYNRCVELVQYCNQHGIQITSHSCLTKGKKFQEPIVLELCSKYQCRPAQIFLAWYHAKCIPAIFRTSNLDHLEDNLIEIQLMKEDIERLDELDEGYLTHPQYEFVKSRKFM